MESRVFFYYLIYDRTKIYIIVINQLKNERFRYCSKIISKKLMALRLNSLIKKKIDFFLFAVEL